MSVIIKGYNNKEEIQKWISDYLQKLSPEYIYNGRRIRKPSYDETLEYKKAINLPFLLHKDAIGVDVNNWLTSINEDERVLLVSTIESLLLECKNNNVAESIIKNIYIRLMIAIKYKFKKLIKEKGKLIYIGSPDKYEFVILSLLKELDIEIIIISLKEEIELIIDNRFEVKDGSIKESLDYSVEKRIERINEVVDTSFGDNIDMLEIVNESIDERNKYIHLEVVGVIGEGKYEEAIDILIKKAKALSRNCIIVEEIPNPSFEETSEFNKGLSYENISPDLLLLINKELDNLVERQEFKIESKKINYRNVMTIWFKRYLDKLYKEGNKIPLLILWGSFSKREKEFIDLISHLAIDIVHFAPSEKDVFNSALKLSQKIVIGNFSDKFPLLPKYVAPSKVETVAYKAERELDTLLYSGTGMYRHKQFKTIEAIILKTTYDEVGILWNQEAKYRPSFETIGNLVRVGTIFTKINGIPYDNKDEYLLKVKGLINENAILYQNLPFTEDKSADWSSFVRQTVYKNEIDYNKIKNSNYYKYGVYSNETQALIIEKTEELLKLDWCNSNVNNLIYKVIEVIFSLPQDIIQLIHGYNFTGQIPKLVIFSGNTNVCSLEDCITIMFLKLVGFDILILAPTGYQLVENHIKPELFNNIKTGGYDFDIESIYEKKQEKQEGFFKNLINKIGGV